MNRPIVYQSDIASIYLTNRHVTSIDHLIDQPQLTDPLMNKLID